MTRIVSVLLIAMLAGAVRADVVILKDGTRIEGDLKRTTSGYDITTKDGKVKQIASASIQSIQLGKSGPAAAPSAANDRLASLKRSVESLSDLNQILARYTAFAEQNKGTPAAAEAVREMATWNERLEKQMVKIAGKWVTPDEQTQMLAQVGDMAKQAHQLMKQNQLKEAEPVVRKALEIDPQNPVANYLLGVLLYRQDKFVPARKAFEVAHAAVPSDAATLNNLGVIAWRQNQFITSLGFYNEAMLAMPANKEILGNVAEALAALKEDFRKHQVAQRTSRLFTEQQARLEALMAQYGWYRWGSQWLDQRRLDELKKLEQEHKQKMDALQKKFDDEKKKQSDNEARITELQRYMDDLLASSTYIDHNTGRAIRTALPDDYYRAGREAQTLSTANDTINKRLDEMRVEARKLEASKPVPKFSGVQQIIGVEGTPRVAGILDEPTSAPAPITAPNESTTSPTTGPTAAPVPSTEPIDPAAPATNRVF